MSPYVTVNLLSVAPKVQQALLLGDLHLSERRVRAMAGRAEWNEPGPGVKVVARQE